MESTTTRAGGRSSKTPATARHVGHLEEQEGGGTRTETFGPHRTWAADSSADTSTTGAPVAATDRRTWSSRVDLPTPGSPP